MARKKKSNAEEAESCWRWVRGLRIYGLVLFCLAALFAAVAIVGFAMGDVGPGISILISAAVVAFWGWFARYVQADQFSEHAKTFERLAAWDRSFDERGFQLFA